jgi:formate dehydrogenase
VTGSNVVSVAEHVVMTILILIRNYNPAHEMIERGEWNVAEAAKAEYDLEGKVVGTVAVGRIGERVLRRLKPFDCKELLYYDYQPLSPEKEAEIGCRRVTDLEEMIAQCDVVTINCPLHEKTRGLFNKELISKMKKGKQFSHLAHSPFGCPVGRCDCPWTWQYRPFVGLDRE